MTDSRNSGPLKIQPDGGFEIDDTPPFLVDLIPEDDPVRYPEDGDEDEGGEA